MRFAAIDFETADHGRDSACSVALVTVERGEVVDRTQFLIRPPRKEFLFTHIHGITWRKVANKPTFKDLWPSLEEKCRAVKFLAAHNAPFDKGVLHTCCRANGIKPPPTKFVCTVQLARQVWKIYPTKLPDVCRHLGITLRHHDALSDAEACANIVMKAKGTAPLE